jgi:hypothetical protein
MNILLLPTKGESLWCIEQSFCRIFVLGGAASATRSLGCFRVHSFGVIDSPGSFAANSHPERLFALLGVSSIDQSKFGPSLPATDFGGRLTPCVAAEQRYVNDQPDILFIFAWID